MRFDKHIYINQDVYSVIKVRGGGCASAGRVGRRQALRMPASAKLVGGQSLALSIINLPTQRHKTTQRDTAGSYYSRCDGACYTIFFGSLSFRSVLALLIYLCISAGP